MKNLVLIGLFFPLLYIGCGESTLKEDKNEINMTVKPVESTQKDLLNQLGFDIKNERISIDINKTTDFFKKMEIEMHGKADKIQHKIKKADINFTRDLGISFIDEKVQIDLNKTKKMFEQINILMKEVLLEGNSSKP